MYKSIPCALARSHIPCTLTCPADKWLLHGCKTHNRRRQQVKRDHCIYGRVLKHCWCGYDLDAKYLGSGKWQYFVYEKKYCTPEEHFSDAGLNRCGYGGTQCGWHGITYAHCIQCGLPYEEPLGEVNGRWKYGPLDLVKQIYRTLTNASVAQRQSRDL